MASIWIATEIGGKFLRLPASEIGLPDYACDVSYRVFARNSRPQTFEEVVGQEHITRTLQNAITSGAWRRPIFSSVRAVSGKPPPRESSRRRSIVQRTDRHTVLQMRCLPRDRRRTELGCPGNRRRE